MNDTALPALLEFLAGAPALQGMALRAEDAGPAPGTGGVWPRGVTVLRCRADVLGGTSLRCRAEFLLRLCLPQPPGDAAQAAQNAGRLLALQAWVAAQSAAGRAPRFGSDPDAPETLAAAAGRLERADPGGTARYTLRLLAEYTDFYKEDTA